MKPDLCKTIAVTIIAVFAAYSTVRAGPRGETTAGGRSTPEMQSSSEPPTTTPANPIGFKVKKEELPSRCEICHKSDEFDPLTNQCIRCSTVLSQPTATNPGGPARGGPVAPRQLVPSVLTEEQTAQFRVDNLIRNFVLSKLISYSNLQNTLNDNRTLSHLQITATIKRQRDLMIQLERAVNQLQTAFDRDVGADRIKNGLRKWVPSRRRWIEPVLAAAGAFIYLVQWQYYRVEFDWVGLGTTALAFGIPRMLYHAWTVYRDRRVMALGRTQADMYWDRIRTDIIDADTFSAAESWFFGSYQQARDSNERVQFFIDDMRQLIAQENQALEDSQKNYNALWYDIRRMLKADRGSWWRMFSTQPRSETSGLEAQLLRSLLRIRTDKSSYRKNLPFDELYRVWLRTRIHVFEHLAANAPEEFAQFEMLNPACVLMFSREPVEQAAPTM